jgi:fatty-acyl-CoA synthase
MHLVTISLQRTNGCVCFVIRRLLRVDPEAKERPLRDADGFCSLADFNEPGLLTSEINPNVVNSRFDGYSDKESTDKKILRNVFKEGDTYFNTGQCMLAISTSEAD